MAALRRSAETTDGRSASKAAGQRRRPIAVILALRQRWRLNRTLRQLGRLIDEAPTSTVRNDLMTIIARAEASGRTAAGQFPARRS